MKKTASIFTILAILLTISSVFASDTADILNKTAEYAYTAVPEPEPGSTNGDWTVLGLARSGYVAGEDYYDDYYNRVKEYVELNKGILSKTKNTEYSRFIVVLTAIGRNPSDVAGYDLIRPLGDYEQTIQQGINGAAWALIALDCGGYDIPVNTGAKTQATRDMYIKYIMDSALTDGGFSFSGEGAADADLTAFAIQALSPYKDRADIKKTTDNALACLSAMQEPDGGFSGAGEKSSESTAQAIVALTSANIPLDDEKFVKNGNSLMDNLMTFYTDGGFKHSPGETEPNMMATEQCLYALAAAKRAEEGKNKLYDMSDVISVTDNTTEEEKTEEIKTFADTENSPYRQAVESLAGQGIINGKSDTEFDPEGTVTRAEFAAIIVRALELEAKGSNNFNDVSESDWFFTAVSAAYENGIINGISDTEFNPYGNITREEAAVMAARAAEYAGSDTGMNDDTIRNVLAQFTDYTAVSEWAREPLAFCYDIGILSQDNIEILPKKTALRGETAQIVYNLLRI